MEISADTLLNLWKITAAICGSVIALGVFIARSAYKVGSSVRGVNASIIETNKTIVAFAERNHGDHEIIQTSVDKVENTVDTLATSHTKVDKRLVSVEARLDTACKVFTAKDG